MHVADQGATGRADRVPGASKAAFLRTKLEAHGIELHVPDLNVPSFEGVPPGDHLVVVRVVVSSQF